MVDVAVVVYNERPLSLNSSGQISEYVYTNNQVTFDTVRNNVISINWNTGGATKPPLRVGGWVLDASLKTTVVITQTLKPKGGKALQQKFATANGYFYRVVGITDTGSTSMDIEIATPPITRIHNAVATDAQIRPTFACFLSSDLSPFAEVMKAAITIPIPPHPATGATKQAIPRNIPALALLLSFSSSVNFLMPKAGGGTGRG